MLLNVKAPCDVTYDSWYTLESQVGPQTPIGKGLLMV